MIPRRRRLMRAAATLILLAGCSAPGAPTTRPPSAPGAPATQGPSTPGASPTRESDGGAAAAGIDAANPPAPVGTVRVACRPGEPLTEATISVLGVRRRGAVAVASFVVTGVRVPGATAPATETGYGSLGHCSNAGFEPRLVDGANLVAYRPLVLGVADRLSTNPYDVFPGAAPTYLTAVFPAPKAGVTSVDVYVGSGSVASVPVS